MGKLLHEISAVRDGNHALRRTMKEVITTVGEVSDKMEDMHSRLDNIHALVILLVDQLNVSRHGAPATQRASLSHWITAPDARKFWTDNFPCDDEVPWTRFALALESAFPDLATPAALALLRKRIDADADGIVHARELDSRRRGRRDSLHAAGAAAGAEDADGTTELWRAARGDDAAGVRALLALGADPNHAQTLHGATPLHAAACNGYAEVARALLEAGARWDVLDGFGATAAEAAQAHPGILGLIHSCGRAASPRRLTSPRRPCAEDGARGSHARAC